MGSLLRRIRATPPEGAAVATGSPPTSRAQRLPRTQEQVMVVAAQDGVLVLRDGSVVAAVGVSSTDDALLTPLELQSRLTAFRDDLLKRLRFDVQLLIGTRPQDLDRYHRQLEGQVRRLASMEALLESMRERLNGYWAGCAHASPEAFQAHFGFNPDDLTGTPGMAHDVAWEMCQDEVLQLWKSQAPSLQEAMSADLQAAVRGSIDALAHWQDVLYERSAFVEATVSALQAPVRTLYLVTSHNPRLVAKPVRGGPLTEKELARARQELDRRCDQLARGVGRMKLPAWRASHEELLNDVRHFYHPAQGQLARRDALLR
jgi:hypothetical protein